MPSGSPAAGVCRATPSPVGFGYRGGDGAGPELRIVVAEPAEQVHRAAHPGERRAQLVRAVRQELAHPLVGPVK